MWEISTLKVSRVRFIDWLSVGRVETWGTPKRWGNPVGARG